MNPATNHLPILRQGQSYLAVMFMATLTACATNESSHESHHADHQVPEARQASLVIPDGFTTNGQDASVHYIMADSRSGSPFQVDLIPGPHALNVSVKWSNGYMDETSVAMNAEAGRNYRVNAFELYPGQNPDDATLRPGPPRPVRSFGADLASQAMLGAATGAVYGSAFLWGPFYLLYKAVSPSTPSTPAPPEPKARPFEKCCFVWIEDMSNGALVGGKIPSGLDKNKLH